MTTTPSSSAVTVLPTQMPFWPNDMRGLPNSFAHSALFSVGNPSSGGLRETLKREKIASLPKISLTYTGERLLQCDGDVLLCILHLSRNSQIGDPIRFTAFSMICELGWTRNKGSYKRLVDCLDRLNASSLALTVLGDDGITRNYTGSLIRSFRWQESSSDAPLRLWEVLLESEIVTLFAPDAYSRLEWNLRLKLPPLAKFLHSYYVADVVPLPATVEFLHRVTASGIRELRMFRFKLRAALQLLVDHGFLISFDIDSRSDLVTVKRVPRRQLIEQ